MSSSSPPVSPSTPLTWRGRASSIGLCWNPCALSMCSCGHNSNRGVLARAVRPAGKSQRRIPVQPLQVARGGGSPFIPSAAVTGRGRPATEEAPDSGTCAWWSLRLLPSSVVPLIVVENEHRLYLPGVGFAVTAASCLWQQAKRGRWPSFLWLCILSSWSRVHFSGGSLGRRAEHGRMRPGRGPRCCNPTFDRQMP